MPYRIRENFPVWGEHDEETLRQLVTCARAGSAPAAALMADGHKGYSQPIGGVVAYERYISPSGVGFDIACGNKAVRTNLTWGEIRRDLPRIMDAIFNTVSFGIGRRNPQPVDHPLFDDPTWREVKHLQELKPLAYEQLGTVGGGNHYVDLLVEVDRDRWALEPGPDRADQPAGVRVEEIPDSAPVWVAVHFGSRGFGYKVASGFLNLASGKPFDGTFREPGMDMPPTLIPVSSELGQAYIAAMNLAGRYAYAGRDYVVDQVLGILGARATFTVHNHHNFAWLEEHGGRKLWVIRKGATPLWPGQLGFVGGSMGDMAVVIRGVESPESAAALYSTIHGSGRVMSRTQAAGKWKRVGGRRVRVGGLVDMDQVRRQLKARGIELRGGGADEAPVVYRPLREVLRYHAPTFEVLHVLRPVGVAMAPPEEYDPYQD